jgi:hypothetical protein
MVRTPAVLFLSLSPASPAPHGLAVEPEPPPAIVPPFRPPWPLLITLIGFPSSPSTSPSKPRSKPRPGTRFHGFPGEQPPHAVAPASPPAPRRRSSAAPNRHPIPTVGSRSHGPDPISPESNGSNTGQPMTFCSLALKFSGTQPVVLSSSKVIADRSFSFCLGPCSFPK